MKTKILFLVAPLLGACANCPPVNPEWVYTAPNYQYEPSLRTSPHHPSHSERSVPEVAGRTPQPGDVMFSKQNRYPVRVDYHGTPARDLGAAYSLPTNQHVVTRVTPNQAVDQWLDNPLDTDPYFRDPECYHPSKALQTGMADACSARKRASSDSSMRSRAPGALSAYTEPVIPKADPRPKMIDPPKPIRQTPELLPEAYCFGDMNPEKDNCLWPK